ncbi:helix-turn-helix domain-containing protein [Blastococcus saxobsidens]|uniref:Transcriptional regulator, XRE family n=1 Tax=Blastococcus saxobsidens (strain DD2) TaxID=1146883 RepID=H6RX03_BLASD|nr:XRE family transcriptional regulator [Blastococcus saxobsidens]CCG03411.1 Transcriptional regulator, XRE family [Blastococcus saxobsidens DD2]
MGDLEMLGRNVRRIRGERQLSLGALAEKSGLAKQTLANLESGGGNPTVDTLLRVARALGVGVNWLVTEWGSPVLVQRRKDGTWDRAGSGRRRVLDHIHGSGDVNTAVVELSDARDVAPPLSPGTLHHVYVISGSVVAGPADDAHRLDCGDFIRFPADMKHVLRAASGTGLVHVVTTVPQVQQFSPG